MHGIGNNRMADMEFMRSCCVHEDAGDYEWYISRLRSRRESTLEGGCPHTRTGPSPWVARDEESFLYYGPIVDRKLGLCVIKKGPGHVCTEEKQSDSKFQHMLHVLAWLRARERLGIALVR
eukprot:5990172-Amphidinium_carterae.1